MWLLDFSIIVNCGYTGSGIWTCPSKMEKKISKNHFYNPAGSFKKPSGSLKSLQ
jgi:hypothetical protein